MNEHGNLNKRCSQSATNKKVYNNKYILKRKAGRSVMMPPQGNKKIQTTQIQISKSK